MRFPVYKAYEYNDKDGKHYLVLTEKIYKTVGEESLNDSVMAFSLLENNDKLLIIWKITDFIINSNTSNASENAIWFWTKYVSVKDIDGDWLADPVIVYGTSGNNGTEDGRIKILIYYKGTKCGIRHQNGVLDHDRNTRIDAAFYELPDVVQTHIKDIMQKMTENNQAIFPYGWEKAMKNKATEIKE